MLSLDDLPTVDAAVPGMWLVQLREQVSGGVGNAIYELGKNTTPIDGSWLRRVVVCMGVVGAMRVDGPECLIGDCSTLVPAPAAPPEPAPAPVEKHGAGTHEDKHVDESHDAKAQKAKKK